MNAGYIKALDASLRECPTTDDKVSYMRGAMRAHTIYMSARQQGKSELTRQLKSRQDKLLAKQKKERGL